MGEEDNINIDKWEQKRNKTLFVYILQNILNGIEFSLVDSTAWYYVTTLMDVKTTKIYYGLISSMIYVCPIIFVTPVSKWLDKKREVSKILVLFNIFNLFGSVLYMIPFSPYYPVVARFLHGFNLILRSAMTAEIARSYPDNELQRKIPSLAFGVFSGEAIGSAIAFSFINIDFWIGPVHITYGNVCGIPLLILTILQVFVIIGMSHDLSKEYDLKAETIKDILDNPTESCKDKKKNIIALQFDYWFLTCMAFYCGTWIQLPLRLYPLIIGKLNYPQEIITMLFFSYAILNVLLLLLVIHFKFSSKAVYYSGLCSLFFLVIEAVCLLNISASYNLTINALFLVVLLLSQCIFNLMDRVFITITIEKLLYSTNQASGGSLRLLSYFFGCTAGSLAAAYVYEYFHYLFFIHLSLCIVFFVTMYARKSSLSNPKPSL